MEALNFIGGTVLLLAGNMLIMYVLAWVLTEVYPLPWNVKPFTCRGCMSFWLTCIGGVAISFAAPAICPDVFGQESLLIESFLTAILNFIYIKTKFKIYE